MQCLEVEVKDAVIPACWSIYPGSGRLGTAATWSVGWGGGKAKENIKIKVSFLP